MKKIFKIFSLAVAFIGLSFTSLALTNSWEKVDDYHYNIYMKYPNAPSMQLSDALGLDSLTYIFNSSIRTDSLGYVIPYSDGVVKYLNRSKDTVTITVWKDGLLSASFVRNQGEDMMNIMKIMSFWPGQDWNMVKAFIPSNFVQNALFPALTQALLSWHSTDTNVAYIGEGNSIVVKKPGTVHFWATSEIHNVSSDSIQYIVPEYCYNIQSHDSLNVYSLSKNASVNINLLVPAYADAQFEYHISDNGGAVITGDSLFVSNFGPVTISAVCTNHSDIPAASFTYNFIKIENVFNESTITIEQGQSRTLQYNDLFRYSGMTVSLVNPINNIDSVATYYDYGNSLSVTGTNVGQSIRVAIDTKTNVAIDTLTVVVIKAAMKFQAYTVDSISYVGQSTQILYKITPADSVNRTFSYISNDISVVVVNQVGTVTAVGEGSTFVKVVCNEDASIYCNVYLDIQKVQSISKYFTQRTIDVMVGQTMRLPINSDFDNNGSWINTYGFGRDVASIDSISKIVAGIKPGSIDIFAYFDGGRYDTITVNVIKDTLALSNVCFSKDKLVLKPGETVSIPLNPNYAYANNIVLSNIETTFATVDKVNKTISGISEGSFNLIAFKDGALVATLPVIVTDGPKTMKIIASRTSLEVGDTLILSAKYEATNELVSLLKYSCPSDSIAYVTYDGFLTALRPGIAIITALDELGNSATIVIEIADKITDTAYFTGESIMVRQGSTVAIPRNSALDPYVSLRVISGGSSILLDTTLMTIKGLYSTDEPIVVGCFNRAGEKIDELSVQISFGMLGISARSTKMQLEVGDTAVISAIYLPNNTPARVANFHIDQTIATIDQNGIFTALKAGNATVVITDSMGLTVTITIVIVDKSVPAAIESVKVINSGYAIEVTFDKPVVLYDGIENDFTIALFDSSTTKSGSQYTVTKVMVKEGDPYTLVLVFETPVPSSNISVTFSSSDTFNALASGEVAARSSSIKAYPVPAASTLHVEVAGLIGVELISFEGTIVAQASSANGSSVELPVSGLPSGLYVAKVYAADGVSTKIIEKK